MVPQRGYGIAPVSTRRLIEQFTQAPTAAPTLDLLTSRELDVLRLLARGLTKAEMAAPLVVEPSTVKSHVASRLAKARPARPCSSGRLGLRERPRTRRREL